MRDRILLLYFPADSVWVGLLCLLFFVGGSFGFVLYIWTQLQLFRGRLLVTCLIPAV